MNLFPHIDLETENFSPPFYANFLIEQNNASANGEQGIRSPFENRPGRFPPFFFPFSLITKFLTVCESGVRTTVERLSSRTSERTSGDDTALQAPPLCTTSRRARRNTSPRSSCWSSPSTKTSRVRRLGATGAGGFRAVVVPPRYSERHSAALLSRLLARALNCIFIF